MEATELENTSDRYLSLCLHQALESDALSPSDFIEIFPPPLLMEALEAAPALRAELLTETAGVHAKIAPKKSTPAAAEDLQIALEEALCTPEDVLNLITVENFVRHFDAAALWSLLAHDEFWKNENDASRDRVLFMLQTALDLELVDVPQLLQAVSPEQILSGMPREDLEHALLQGLILGLEGAAFSPEEFLNTIPLEAWLQYVPLQHMWDTAIVSEIAVAAGISPSAAKAAAADADAKKRKRKKRASMTAASTHSSAPPPPSSESAETKARKRAMDALSSRDRLPKNPAQLRTPVLLGLESMYADLLTLEEDEQRAACIREAFPNEEMLKEALLALAETLDPRLTESELRTKDTDVSGLVQLVLFEERRLANRAKGISPSSPPPPMKLGQTAPPPPPLSAVSAKQSAPPPLPAPSRRAPTPPPPPLQARRQ